jgi:hypothetical protein
MLAERDLVLQVEGKHFRLRPDGAVAGKSGAGAEFHVRNLIGSARAITVRRPELVVGTPVKKPLIRSLRVS